MEGGLNKRQLLRGALAAAVGTSTVAGGAEAANLREKKTAAPKETLPKNKERMDRAEELARLKFHSEELRKQVAALEVLEQQSIADGAGAVPQLMEELSIKKQILGQADTIVKLIRDK